MASRKSNRIELNEWMGKSNKKRKSTPEEAINIDDDTVIEDLFEKLTPSAKKKNKKNAEAEQGSSSKKMNVEKDSGDHDRKKDKKKKKIKKDKGKEVQPETANLEPKKKSGKNSTISAQWFISKESEDKWLKGFASKPISFCTMVCTNLIEKLQLNCMERLKESSVWKILNPHDAAYPRLTRLFYLNLQAVEGNRLILSSRVAGKDIILDHSVFAKVLGCAENYNVDNHPVMKEGNRLARLEFFLPNYTSSSNSKQLTHTVLTAEAKILFNILMRCVFPKENSRELLSEKILYVMHLIMQGYEVDLPKLVMEYMLYSSTQQRNHFLPYANLLPLFFKHFGISVKHEEKVTFGMGLISEVTLQRLGIVRNVKDEWKFQKSIPVEEIKIKKFARLKTLTDPKPSPSIPVDSSFALDRLESIEFDIDELKQGQLELCTEFRSMRFMLNAMSSQVSKVFKALKLEASSSEEKVSKPSDSHTVSLEENLNADPSKDSEHKDNDSIESDIPLAERLIRIRRTAPVTVTSEDLFEDADGEAAQGSDAAQDEEEEKDASDETEDTGDEEKEKEDTDNEEEKEDTED